MSKPTRNAGDDTTFAMYAILDNRRFSTAWNIEKTQRQMK